MRSPQALVHAVDLARQPHPPLQQLCAADVQDDVVDVLAGRADRADEKRIPARRAIGGRLHLGADYPEDGSDDAGEEQADKREYRHERCNIPDWC